MKSIFRHELNKQLFKPQRSQLGFTLIEVMITVAIIGILAAIAMPNYTQYVQRGRAAEATSRLADLRVQMEQGYQDNRFYTCPAAAVLAAGAQSFAFACAVGAGATPQTYTFTATGLAARNMTNFEFTINEANARTSKFDSASSVNCWLTSKGGTC